MSEFSLPLFPLQTVLFPDGVLPLRIFEVRYLDLISRCQKEGAPFGVVCMTRGSEVRQPPQDEGAAPWQAFAPEAFHDVGTLAQIVAFERVQPGLMQVRCVGGRRFRLRNSEQLKHGLWMGQAQWLANDVVTPVPADLAHVQRALKKLVAQPQGATGAGDAPPVPMPPRWDESGWVANRWCEFLPISLELKQRFMMLDNPLLRLELVSDLLDRLKISTRPAPG